MADRSRTDTPRMNIYSEPGTKVRFAYRGAGYSHHQETAAKHLTNGAVYTVDHTDVGSCHTDVFLKEIPGVAFNSVLFAPVGASCYYCGRPIRGKVYYLGDSVYPFFTEICRKCREEHESGR